MATMKRIDGIWNPIFDKQKKTKIERNIVQILKNVPIFEDLSNRESQNIARIAYQRHYSENEVVIHEGQDSAGMYILMEGEVKITKELEDGTVIDVGTLEEGEFFGDVGLLDSSPRTATVTASQDSKILGFFRPELLQLMDSDPKLASKVIFKLAQILAARFRYIHKEFEKAQVENDRLNALLKDVLETKDQKKTQM
ncbi:MAG: cyclic nucleotide-binding domain-containing protein [Candidatus Poribacteria bacterium]|nr:cyclic nucleotide-binding domain-containing protein [Candidatus Poribacteria bacterium]